MNLQELVEKAKGFNLNQEEIDKDEQNRVSFIKRFPLEKMEDML